MKKILYFAVAALAATAFFACNQDNEVTGKDTVDYSKLVINEANAVAATDSAKFVELYNGGDKDIPLKGVYINRTDETGLVELTWSGIDGEVVPAKGFFVIQGTKNAMERSMIKGLSAKKGVKLEVFGPDDASITSVQHGILTDATAKTKIQTGIWARIPDGGAWKNVTNETPGKANDATGAQDDDELK